MLNPNSGVNGVGGGPNPLAGIFQQVLQDPNIGNLMGNLFQGRVLVFPSPLLLLSLCFTPPLSLSTYPAPSIHSTFIFPDSLPLIPPVRSSSLQVQRQGQPGGGQPGQPGQQPMPDMNNILNSVSGLLNSLGQPPNPQAGGGVGGATPVGAPQNRGGAAQPPPNVNNMMNLFSQLGQVGFSFSSSSLSLFQFRFFPFSHLLLVFIFSPTFSFMVYLWLYLGDEWSCCYSGGCSLLHYSCCHLLRLPFRLPSTSLIYPYLHPCSFYLHFRSFCHE